MEYTYDDIITAKDILTGKVKEADILGKSGWFLDCIPQDMSLNVIMRIGSFSKLESINLNHDYPFDSEDEYHNTYFLPEKKVLAPKEPTVEDFSIGDRVVFLSPANCIPRYLVEKEGRIVSKGTFALQIMFDGSSEVWGILPENLRKIEDKPSSNIKEVDLSVFSSLETIWEIAPSLCPRIKGYTINDSGGIIAFDNTAGEFYTESFDTREEAIRWLNGTGTKEEMDLKQVESIPESQLEGYYNSRKPEYVPFDLSREEDRQLLRDAWIKSKYNDREARVSAFKHDEIRGWLAHIPQTGMRDGEQLFNGYTFLDGSPCGKQMASK